MNMFTALLRFSDDDGLKIKWECALIRSAITYKLLNTYKGRDINDLDFTQ